MPPTHKVRLPLGTREEATKHPSRGGNPYSQEYRLLVISIYQEGGWQALCTPEYDALRALKKFPCRSTCKSWIRLQEHYGHIFPKRKSGNKFSTREITGVDLFNLTICYRMMRPKAYINEVRAYVNNMNPANPPYLHSQIHRAEQKLGLSRKVGSSTSVEAYRPINMLKRQRYWQMAFPYGIRGEDINTIIDIDESAYKLQSQDRKRGKTVRCKRCNTRGMYNKGAGKVSLILGICGDGEEGLAFHRLYPQGGTNLWRFYTFMSDFIDFLEENRPGQSFCFTMDNLNIHKHPVILDLIQEAGHRIVFRAPYWSCDGAIEYVFNTIHTLLQMSSAGNGARTVEQLMDRLDDIIHQLKIVSFKSYFLNVGFKEVWD